MTAFISFYRCARRTILQSSAMIPSVKRESIRALCSKTQELVNYLDALKNFEKSGVPENAGTETDDGFDLGRMKRLMDRLGNPQSKYKVCSPKLCLFNILPHLAHCYVCHYFVILLDEFQYTKSFFF